MPIDPCLKTSRIFGPCSNAPEHSTGDPAHVVGMKLFCESCCPDCHPPVDERPISASGPVEGVQGVLWG
jgi:hypothetical protein